MVLVAFLGLEPDEKRLTCMHGRTFKGFLRRWPAVAGSLYSGPTIARVQAVVGEVGRCSTTGGRSPSRSTSTQASVLGQCRAVDIPP
jgi:hypothetical protein